MEHWKGYYVGTVDWKGTCRIFDVDVRWCRYFVIQWTVVTLPTMFAVICPVQVGHEKNLVGDVARGAGDCTRVVEQANYMRKTALSVELMTHGSSTSLTWKWEGILEGHADVRAEFRDWPANLLAMNEWDVPWMCTPLIRQQTYRGWHLA
jgi:hypothetical protein